MTATSVYLERAMSRVRQDGDCLIWIAARHPHGYGVMRIENRLQLMHRWFYELANGPIPGGLVIDHLCRRPPCVKVSHLEAVTQRENVLRGEHFAAVVFRTGKCRRGHERNTETSYLRPNGDRVCRVCELVWMERYNERRRRTRRPPV